MLRTHAFGILLTSLVSLCGAWAVWTVTDGMQAFTWESSRRLNVSRAPIQLRQTRCGDGHGCGMAGDGPVRIVDFIYTRCQDVCLGSGGIYRQLADQLGREIASARVRLISVGFDRSHDTPEALSKYLRRFGAPAGWTATSPHSDEDLEILKSDFGLVVVPDGRGGYAHNAPISVVDARGRLVAVYDFDDLERVIGLARTLAASRL